MGELNLHINRSDLLIENQSYKFNCKKDLVFVTSSKNNQYIYRTIYFKNVDYYLHIKNILKQELLFFLGNLELKEKYHAFIVGIGNDNHTADSVGPKALKHVIVNSHLEKLGLTIHYPKVSALEPGVLSETGISTKQIIESVVKEIKPDIIILIDSYVSKNINYLNKCIQITNEGITPGSGLHSINAEISYQTLGIPILVIGVPTAIEVNFHSNNSSYLLSTKDIDIYINKISKIIGEAINECLYYE